MSDEPPDLSSIPEESSEPRVYHRERDYRPRTPITSPISDDWGTSYPGGNDFDHEEIAGTAFLDRIRGNTLK